MSRVRRCSSFVTQMAHGQRGVGAHLDERVSDVAAVVVVALLRRLVNVDGGDDDVVAFVHRPHGLLRLMGCTTSPLPA